MSELKKLPKMNSEKKNQEKSGVKYYYLKIPEFLGVIINMKNFIKCIGYSILLVWWLQKLYVSIGTQLRCVLGCFIYQEKFPGFFIQDNVFWFFVFFFFSGPHPQHMEVLRLGVESELQLLAYATATATWVLSRIYNLHHSSRQW